MNWCLKMEYEDGFVIHSKVNYGEDLEGSMKIAQAMYYSDDHGSPTVRSFTFADMILEAEVRRG